MKAHPLAAAANIGVMFLLVLAMEAEAAELKVLSAFGMQSVLEDLGPKFEHATARSPASMSSVRCRAIFRTPSSLRRLS